MLSPEYVEVSKPVSTVIASIGAKTPESSKREICDSGYCLHYIPAGRLGRNDVLPARTLTLKGTHPQKTTTRVCGPAETRLLFSPPAHVSRRLQLHYVNIIA